MVILAGLAGWLFLTALIAVTGLVLSRWWLPGAAWRSVHPQAALRRWGLAFAMLLLVGLVAVLARQLAEFRDPFAPLGEDASLLSGLTAIPG